jgi:hypothetical protein
MNAKTERASKGAVMAMISILVALLLVSIYANWQKSRRDKIESATLTRLTPSPSPSATP